MKKRTRTSTPKFSDILWKAVVSDLFFEFAEACHPKLYQILDQSKPVVFLDKEFPSLFPRKRGKNRRADVVAMAFDKSGKQMAIVVHVEVQGYPDPEFADRMNTYNYRAGEKYHLPVESMALLTDNDPAFRPKQYFSKVVVTERSLKFHTIKLMDLDPKKLRKSKKLFDMALEVAWYGLRKNKLTDDDLYRVKMDLMRRLKRRKVPNDKIMSMLFFIAAIVSFDDKAKSDNFEAQLFMYDKNFNMGSAATITEEMPRTFRALIEMQRETRNRQEVLDEQIRIQKAETRRTKQQLKKAEEERQRAEQERQRAEQDRQRAEQECHRAEQDRQRAEQDRQRAEQDRQRDLTEKTKAIQLLLQKGVSPAEISSIVGIPEAAILELDK